MKSWDQCPWISPTTCDALALMNGRELISWNMRRLRGEKGISQERLANEAGVDRTYVSRLERWLENPSIGILEKIANALGAHVSELLREPVDGEKLTQLKAGRKPKEKRS
jgi:transcriptional regulator with XRE-family HTH domain